MREHDLWLSFAYEDLLSAEALHEKSLYNSSAYHCQQSAEKSLKAFLVFKNSSIPRTHNVVHLLQLCGVHEKDFKKIMINTARLEPFSTATRYPDNFIEVAKDKSLMLIADAKKILDFVVSKIEASTGHHQMIIFPRI